jgi:FkbM family methyltransferase
MRFLTFSARHQLNRTSFSVPLVQGINEGLLYMGRSFQFDLIEILDRISSVRQFVDVGAHFGSTMLEVASFSRGMSYYGIEPNPTSYFLLEQLARKNNLKAVLFPLACGEKYQVLPLHKLSLVDSGATIVPEIRPGAYDGNSHGYVTVAPLDALAEHMMLNRHFLLKIDVEGAEFLVLRGAEQTIRRYRPFIVCEVLHAHSAEVSQESKSHKVRLRDLLHANDYCLYACELRCGQLQSLHEISEFSVRLFEDAPDECDYVFIPHEKREELARALHEWDFVDHTRAKPHQFSGLRRNERLPPG